MRQLNAGVYFLPVFENENLVETVASRYTIWYEFRQVNICKYVKRRFLT
jgi:hypothetical protein